MFSNVAARADRVKDLLARRFKFKAPAHLAVWQASWYLEEIERRIALRNCCDSWDLKEF